MGPGTQRTQRPSIASLCSLKRQGATAKEIRQTSEAWAAHEQGEPATLCYKRQLHDGRSIWSHRRVCTQFGHHTQATEKNKRSKAIGKADTKGNCRSWQGPV